MLKKYKHTVKQHMCEFTYSLCINSTEDEQTTPLTYGHEKHPYLPKRINSNVSSGPMHEKKKKNENNFKKSLLKKYIFT